MIRWTHLDALARSFAQAQPFRHVVIDGLVGDADLRRLQGAFAEEPQLPVESEIYLHLRGAEPPMTPPLRAFCDALQGSCAQVSAIAGRPLETADGAAYLYLPGHYLLPHSDARSGRTVAYAYYVSPPVRGGELNLFRGSEIARSIAPVANRLVLFEVHDDALHEVAEVLEGVRASVAGWFYA